MTDLIKQLQYLSRVTKDYDQEHMTSADYEMIPAVTKLAADRIEQLEGERDEAMMTGHDLAKIEYRDLVGGLEAKLAKAVEALRFYAYGHTTPPTWQRAHKVLAELGGK